MGAVSSDFIKYAIKIGSKTLDDNYPIQSIIVDKKINKIPYAKIIIYDGDLQSQEFSIANDKIFAIGATVVIQVGYGEELEKIFEGVISKFHIQASSSALSTTTIMCRDIVYKTTLSKKITHFEKKKDSDICKKILGTYKGIKSKIEATTIIHENITQHEITDWDFLNIRAEANGQVVVVNDGEVSIKKPRTNGKGSFTYTYGMDLIDYEVEIDTQDQWAGATALSWDSGQQKAVTVKISEPGDQGLGGLSYSKLTAGLGQNPTAISHAGIVDSAEIKTLATALLSRSRIAKIKGSATVSGNAKLRHDMLITIAKGALQFIGNSYVSGIRHVIGEGMWHTALTLGLKPERYVRKYSDIGALPAAGVMPPIYGLQLGIVKQITQDPKTNGRILVHLPLIHEKPKEGIWCRLASSYATHQAGIFFIPELEDEVVVGFLNDDIRFPIVLGALYSGKHTPPKTVSDKNLFKSFISREKLELTFHDDKEGPEIIIKTPSGGLLQISDKKKSIEITDQNKNSVVLSKDGISLSSNKDISLNAQTSITIKAGKDVAIQSHQNLNLKSMNINAQASMKAVVSGNASTEVKSGMATIIKGTTVLIN